MALCNRAQASLPCASSRRAGFIPFRSSRALSVRVRAEEASSSSAPTINVSKIGALSWDKDTETIKDVFAFGGSAPERANGRVAMIGFTSIALTEASKHTPALEQFGDAAFGVISFSLLITFATIVPKIVSGTSLKELHAAATTPNLQGEGIQAALALFDQSYELWAGRLAMIGVAGLIALETVRGDALF